MVTKYYQVRFYVSNFNIGKCYESATDNFIPRPRKPRIDLEMTMIDELDEKKSPEMKELNQKQNDVEKTSVSDRFYLP